jgi:hypothetical protein
MAEDDFLEVIADFAWNGAGGFWRDIRGDEPSDRILERLSEVLQTKSRLVNLLFIKAIWTHVGLIE